MAQFDIKSKRTIWESRRIDAKNKEEAMAIAVQMKEDKELKADCFWVSPVSTNGPQLLYRLKYWFTGFREILFRAPDEDAAWDWAEEFPENQHEILKDVNGIEERSDYEIELVEENEVN